MRELSSSDNPEWPKGKGLYYTFQGFHCDKKAVEYLSIPLGLGLIMVVALSLAVNSEWFY